MNPLYETLCKEVFKHLYTSSDLCEKAKFALREKKKQITSIKSFLETRISRGDYLAYAIYQVNYEKVVNDLIDKADELKKQIKLEGFLEEELASPLFDLQTACIGRILIDRQKTDDKKLEERKNNNGFQVEEEKKFN